jgi:hypothetical protein
MTFNDNAGVGGDSARRRGGAVAAVAAAGGGIAGPCVHLCDTFGVAGRNT